MRGDWVEADRLYERALALEPEDPTSQFWHAYSCPGLAIWWRRTASAACAGPGSDERRTASLARLHTPRRVNLSQLSLRWQRPRNWGSEDFAYLVRGLIRLAQGDRPGAVESWNRYFQRRGIRTQAPQLVVEALADPRRRPAALAAIDELPPDEFVFHSSVVLGDADRALRVVERSSRGTDVMDNVMWWDLARPMRQTAEFRRLVSAVGLEQLWRARGWPDKCRPKGAGDFVCD